MTYAVQASPFTLEGQKADVYFAGKPTWAWARDRLGSVVGGGKDYFPYGDEIGAATAGNVEKFGSYYRDATTGLDYADQRYFTSLSGRFLTADPIGSGLNQFAYVAGDPVNGNDPSGLSVCWVNQWLKEGDSPWMVFMKCRSDDASQNWGEWGSANGWSPTDMFSNAVLSSDYERTIGVQLDNTAAEGILAQIRYDFVNAVDTNSLSSTCTNAIGLVRQLPLPDEPIGASVSAQSLANTLRSYNLVPVEASSPFLNADGPANAVHNGDGRTIYFNSRYVQSNSWARNFGLLTHELLHAVTGGFSDTSLQRMLFPGDPSMVGASSSNITVFFTVRCGTGLQEKL